VSAEALRRWLNKAEENLKVAETSYRNSFYAASCFHAQQAAELALKALIISRKGYQPFTHSQVELQWSFTRHHRTTSLLSTSFAGFRSTTYSPDT